MPPNDVLFGLDTEQLIVFGTGVGVFIGAVWLALTGMRKTAAKSSAPPAPVVLPICADLRGEIAETRADLQELARLIVAHGQILAVIEDRTRRD